MADPGADLMDHLEESETRKLGSEQRRESVAGDPGGEWTG